MAKLTGRPPSSLTGRLPVSSDESPWWDSVAAALCAREDLLGRVMSIEDIAALVPSYPDGRRPRPRAASRRLRPILELVERGPNGSLGRGATYRIVAPGPMAPVGRADVDDDEITPADDWLCDAVGRMTRKDE